MDKKLTEDQNREIAQRRKNELEKRFMDRLREPLQLIPANYCHLIVEEIHPGKSSFIVDANVNDAVYSEDVVRSIINAIPEFSLQVYTANKTRPFATSL